MITPAIWVLRNGHPWYVIGGTRIHRAELVHIAKRIAITFGCPTWIADYEAQAHVER